MTYQLTGNADVKDLTSHLEGAFSLQSPLLSASDATLPAPVQATFIFHCPYAVYDPTGPLASTVAPLQPILHL